MEPVKPCLIVVDMLKDSFERHPHAAVVQSARTFIARLNRWIDRFHERGDPVVFACDSFFQEDFLFRSRMKPHSLRGTPGAEVIDELHKKPEDLVVEKRRFSAFFKTDLDQTLRMWGVDTVFVAGIATPICVLTTALDAVSHDFQAVIMADCCAAHKPEYHDHVVEVYKNTPLYPLLRVLTSEECEELLDSSGPGSSAPR